jgi:Lactate racemase N-terminal domain
VRVPLLAGSRLAVIDLGENSVVLRPPSPPERGLADVGAAVRDAFRFPLEGEPFARSIDPAGTVTIVIEPPALPLPGSARDPRQEAVAAVVDELRRLGLAAERQTILVAAGLARRPGPREIGMLVPPEFRRRFRGKVVVHDVERGDLSDLGEHEGIPLRVSPQLTETDAVLVVSAAETVLHGGPATLLAAGGTEALRAASARSLLETTGSRGWALARALEHALANRVPVLGVSLVLNLPRPVGAARGFPFEEGAAERLARSPLRRGFGLLPGAVRRRMLRGVPLELTAAGVFGGPPSVAHAEALLRAIELRSVELDRPLDAICIGIPPVTAALPRERPNPLAVAYLGLGLALRLWRDRFPVLDGGTAILLHRFNRRFAHPTQRPYRSIFGPQALRDSPAGTEPLVAGDPQLLEQYRRGRTHHPLLPYVELDALRPARDRLGRVLVAGCRDATAARALRLVPVHNLTTALAMAEGRSGGDARIGFVLAPPYAPLVVR